MKVGRKEIAEETVAYYKQGYYEVNGNKIDISQLQKQSEEGSKLYTPEQGLELIKIIKQKKGQRAITSICDKSTVEKIFEWNREGKTQIGILNFASAKNPGGGFLNGAMAQEESLAASSGLYGTQLKHPRYYEANRGFKSMMYTHHGIYSPEVVFFRDKNFQLVEEPVTASVLTLPAVNMGQVIQKRESIDLAKAAMKERMRIALAIFINEGARYLILGAYGCGVFRNDPLEIAQWWKELIVEENYGVYFDEICFAILDISKDKKCLRAFQRIWS